MTTPCPTPSPTPTTPSPAEAHPGPGRGLAVGLRLEDLAPEHLRQALADLHGLLAVGSVIELEVAGPALDRAPAGARLEDLATGAGFDVVTTAGRRRSRPGVRLRRARTLADSVGPGMRLLVCGLNPSLYAADAGVPFARPGNRFWPAALAAGVASVPGDPGHALRHHGTGMTDLVKRATAGAGELTPEEYRSGMARVERLCGWLAPAAVCFVGLAGWRAARDRRAGVGLQRASLAGRPVYLMPSTSGRNAHVGADALRDHLRAALALAGDPTPRSSCHTSSPY